MNSDAGTQEELENYPFQAPGPLDPPEEWARLRAQCPVAHVRLPSGDKAVLLTRYEDVKQILADPRFTRDLASEDAAKVSTSESGGVFSAAVSSIQSGEGHQRWRRLLNKSFTVRQIQAMTPRIEAMTEQLLTEMIERGHPADLVSSFAFPLPVWVICDLLGVPDADRDRFAYWSNTFLSLTQYTQKEIDAAQAEFSAYILAHVAEKRARPGQDLLSELTQIADAEDGRLSELELMFTAQGLLVAGHETTANMIAKMMAMLLSDRRRYEALVADPSLVRTTVEEALRFDANSGFGLPRFITEDTEVGGTTLPKGTTVICSMASANRDERAFERAEEMDLRRSPNVHLSFGVGAHSCIGQALARTEMQTALAALLRRLPSLELAVPAAELPRREGLVIGGLERVLVRW